MSDIDYCIIAFGNHVKAMREASGLTQGALADAASLDRSYISSIEKGERNVTLSTIVQLAAVFNISPGDLVNQSLDGRSSGLL